MASKIAFPPAAHDYPNALLAPQPARPAASPRYLWLAGLLVTCLLPRMLVASRVESVCPDGVFYLTLAKALTAGDLAGGLQLMHLNTFPVTLAALHRAGIPWDATGKVWGVLISTLVVLPLFGWLRRQFDDRVAVVGCLLYAVQPQLLRWSPEMIRDPSFWFFFTLSLYWLWRAEVEVRPGLFWLAGAAIALAALTRTEGLLLLIPLACWSWTRCRALRQGRRTLVLGVLACLSVAPSLVLLVNLTLLHRHSHWEWARLDPLEFIKIWLRAQAESVTSGETSAAAVGLSFKDMLREFLPSLYKGFSPVFGLLMLGGMAAWWRIWLRRDQQPLFYTSLALLASIWCHLWIGHSTCPRYLLPIVIMASPFAALGLLGLVRQVAGATDRLRVPAGLVRLAIAGCLVVVAMSEVGIALRNDFRQRRVEVELGRWLNQRCGPKPMLVGSHGPTEVVNYYSQGSCRTFPVTAPPDEILVAVGQSHPDMLLLVCTRHQDYHRPELLERIHRAGLRPLDEPKLLNGCRDLMLFVREDSAGPAGRTKVRPALRISLRTSVEAD
jgi:hypothetical protein